MKHRRRDSAPWTSRTLCTLPALILTLAVGCTGGSDVRSGRLQRVVVDRPDRGESVVEYLLETDQGEQIELGLSSDADKELPTGTRLRVVGSMAPAFSSSGNEQTVRPKLIVDSLEHQVPDLSESAEALTLAAPGPPRKLAVFLFNFANDDRQPISIEDARRKVFTDRNSVRAFHKEQSFGFVDLAGKIDPVNGDVFGWYTIPSNNRPCLESKWDDEALAIAKQRGIDPTGYDHYVYIFPYTDACLYGGRGEQPGRNTWINGGSITTMNHELGHNFGTPHASSWSCTNAAGTRITLGGTCRSTEYGNPFDVMGHGYRHTNAFNKARARWLSAANILDVGKNGDYTLFPQEQPSTGVQLLSAVASDTTWYYVEYRQPFGYDDFAPDSAAATGVIVMLGGSMGKLGNSFLLDMNPTTTTFADAPLGVGKTFSDPAADVKITLVERTPQSAKVRFEFAGGSARDAAPPTPADAGSDGRRSDGAGPGDATGSSGGQGGTSNGKDGNADDASDAGSEPAPVAGAGGTAGTGGSGSGGAGGPTGTGGSRRPPPASDPVPTGDESRGCSCSLARASADPARASSPGSWAFLGAGALVVLATRRRGGARRGLRIGQRAAVLVGLILAVSQGCQNEASPPVTEQPSSVGTGGNRAGRGGSNPPPSAGNQGGAAGLDAAISEDAASPQADLGTGADAADARATSDAAAATSRIVVPEAPAEIAAACARYAEVYCARLDECVTDGVRLNYGDVTFCRARREATCRTDLLTPGRRETPKLRLSCTDALAAEKCRDFYFSRPLPACDYPPGGVGKGEPCFRSSQCGAGLSCEIETDEACGTCAPTLPVGGDCSFWTGGCPLGTLCYADQCLAPLGPMAACKRTAASCMGGMACAAEGCIEKIGDVGADCTRADICDTVKGLFCNLMTGKCAANPAPVAIGTLCGVVDATGARSRCAPDASCFAPPASPTRRICVARSMPGGKCDPAVGPVCSPPSECLRGTCVIPSIVAGPPPTYRTCP
jgi:hypothetical protein